MKKTVITIVAGALMGLTAQAQVQPNVLGENHAMVRLESGSKWTTSACVVRTCVWP